MLCMMFTSLPSTAYAAGTAITGWNTETPRRIQTLNLNKQGLTGHVVFGSLALLQIINCDGNELTGVDVSGLTKLSILNCDDNPLEFLKLSDSWQLTVENAPGGQVVCTRCSLSSRLVQLTAVPGSGYEWKQWVVKDKTGLSENALKQANISFFLNEVCSVKPVYTNQLLIPLVDAVEQSVYTLPAAKAETEAMLKESLAEQINLLPELQEAGILVNAADIEVTSFTPGIGGTKENPNGTAGSFAFRVTITKDGVCSEAVADGSITVVKIPGAVAIGDDEYPTLEAAFEAAGDGDTVVLRGDIDLKNDSVWLTGKSRVVALDLCGFTVSNSGTVIELGSANHLTVTDSSAAKSGLIHSTGGHAISANGGNILTIEGGTLRTTGTYKHTIDVWGADVALIVNGGVVEAMEQDGLWERARFKR